MKAIFATDSAIIKIKDVIFEESTGNGMMAVTYGDDDAQIEYQKVFNLSRANKLSFTVKNNGKSEAQLHLIFKLTDAWTWTDNFADPCEVAAGEKKVCSFDISSLADRNQTRSIIVANYAKGFTGTILYDDFATETDTLFNFNEDKYDAFSRGFGNTSEQIPEIRIVFNNEDYIAGISSRNVFKTSRLNVAGSTLQLSLPKEGNVSVGVYTLNGSLASTLHKGPLTAGTHNFDISKLSRGVYLVRAKGANFDTHRTIQIR